MNTAVIGFNDACLDVDHDATWAQAIAGELTFESVHLACSTNFKSDDDNTENGLEAWFNDLPGNGVDTFDIADAYNITAPDYSLNFSSTVTAASTTDSRIETTSFVGAFEGTDDWSAGWTTQELN